MTMPERRSRGPQPRSTTRMPRTTARHTDKTLASGDSVSTAKIGSAYAQKTIRRPNSMINSPMGNTTANGDIYIPPVIQDGWRGRDDVSEYKPYSPTFGGGQVRPWTTNEDFEKKRNKMQPAVAIGSRTAALIERVDRLQSQRDKSERVDRNAARRARASEILSTVTSDNERYQPEYNGMVDGDDDNNSSSTGETGYTDDFTELSRPQSSSRNIVSSSSGNYQKRLPALSTSASESTMRTDASGDTRLTEPNPFALVGSGDKRSKPRQELAYCTIALTSTQLLVLMLQITMCGFAPIDVNPMLGPFPDAISQWGGKNPYLMLHDNEWWRMISPAFLHVGVLHFAANVLCQHTSVSMFEREWGWFKWLFIYIMSELGTSASSNYCDLDTIAVGSSGALMGLFGAKLAQVVTVSFFQTKSVDVDDVIRFDQLCSVLCGLTLVSMLGALTYIDWSGNMGGLITGFFAGILVFSSSIHGCCGQFFWSILGLAGLVGPAGYVMYLFVETSDPEEQLADVCEYFRSFFTEGYECGCMW